VIDHDDYYASRVGKTSEGKQFFVTTPSVPDLGNEPGREFLATYVFDEKGHLVDAQINDLGPRATLDRVGARRLLDQRMAELGPLLYGPIHVRLFSVERFGVIFGLIARPLEDLEGGWLVELHPGNYMAFREPWDSGIYDT